MRVVSSFHDYYDIGMGLGHDNSISFIRTSRDVTLKRTGLKDDLSVEDKATIDLAKSLPRLAGSGYGYGSHCIVIGFCGLFYPVVVFPNADGFNKSVFCYSLEEVDNQVCKTLGKKGQQQYKETSRWGYRHLVKTTFDTYKDLPVNMEPFIINRSPLVVLYERHDLKSTKAVWNARLRDYNFERIIDPYQAFQSIEMFLANLATPEKPIPPRSDNQKVQSHGFDEWSFRKKSQEGK